MSAHASNSSASPSRWVDIKTVRLLHPESGALTLRRIQLLSKNGYRRVLRTQLLWSRKNEGHLFAMRDQELSDAHLDQAFPLTGDQDSCVSQGSAIQWDLNWKSAGASAHSWTPASLSQILGVGAPRVTRVARGFDPCSASGTLKWGNQQADWSGALARSTWTAGRWTMPRWNWVSAPQLQREGGTGLLSFEGYAAPLAGGIYASSFQFEWEGKQHIARGLSRTHEISGSQWDFSLESGQERELVFKGSAQVAQKEIALIPLEDATGRVFYSSSSLMAGATVSVYRRGKLEATFSSPNTCGLEFVSPEPNPYVRPLA